MPAKLAASLLLFYPALFDLDVQLPPGTPMESLIYQKAPVTIRLGGIETGNMSAGAAEGGTGARKTEIRPPSDSPPPISLDVQYIAPIPTSDFRQEVGWAVTAPLGTDTVYEKLLYEPRLSRSSREESYIRAFTTMLMKYCHLNRSIDTEDIIYLALLGAPAGTYAARLKGPSRSFDSFCQKALDYIDEETEPIKFAKDDTMADRIIISELVSYMPFTDSLYAPGLNHFPADELYERIRKLTKHPHKRVRRNAIYYLGTTGHRKNLDLLFETLKNEKDDNVIKVRTLYFLTEYRYPGLAEYLIKRLQKEEDPIFESMIINSLGTLQSPKAFPAVIERLQEVKLGDFEGAYTLIKSATLCLDAGNQDARGKLSRACIRIQKMLDDRNNFPDPEHQVLDPNYDSGLTPKNPPSEIKPSSYVTDARTTILKELTEIALAVAGHGISERKLMTELGSISNKIKRENPSEFPNAPDSWILLQSYQPQTALFLISILPRLKGGKQFLERFLTSGCGSFPSLYAAIDTFAREYPDEFGEVAVQMLKERLNFMVTDRVLKYLFASGLQDKSTKRILEGYIKRYRENMDSGEKHLATLAVYYLGLLKEVDEKLLIRIIKGELSMDGAEEKKDPAGKQLVFYTKLPPESHLYRVAIEMLGLSGSRDAEKFLFRLCRNRNRFVRRVAAKSLGYYTSENTRERLLEMLADTDGWTRLAAYLSLKRITGVEYNTDWYFTNVKGLEHQINEYKDLLEAKKKGHE